MAEDDRFGLGDEEWGELVSAAEPLWDVLARLGFTDAFGGSEFKRVFPQVMIEFIHRTANAMPEEQSEA